MIKSFHDKKAEKLFNRTPSRKLPRSIQRVAMRKLWMLGAATEINDLRMSPGNRLEALRGNRKDQHSIRINQQWRICFVWKQSDAYEVEITDYH